MVFRYIWAWLQTLFGYVKVWPPEAHDSAWLGAAPMMEEEPVTVSLGPIGPLFQQFRSVIASLQGNGRRLRLKGVKAQIQILGQELEWLCIDLKGLPEGPEDAMTRCWVRQVRDLCYDTADYLDELMHFIHCSSGTRCRRIRVRTFGGNRLVGSKTFRISGKLTWLSLPKVKKLKRAPLIAKLSALVARLEDADETRKRFKLSPTTYSKPDYAQAAVLMPQITTPQLDIDKLNKLLDLDGNDMEKNLKVVTIFGSAGVDKTAVARTLYHQHGGRFQHRAFIRVTRDPDMRRLLTDMLSQIKAPPAHEFSDVQGLIASVIKHLQGKRYLIIIDDLWTTSTWDIIIRALPDGDYCRIITTTQVEDVALACCSYQLKHIYEITPLNDDQSGKSEGSCTAYPSSEGMKEDLNLAYNNLPPRLKTCLLYLNMYPEGYTVWKDELVKQWLAEGFIGLVQGQDIEDTAGYYFDALVSSGLVQSVDTNHNGEVLSCTLHHLVLDLIRQKSMEENFVTIVNYFQTILGLPDKVRRLSVQLGGAKCANHIPENMRISQVRSLLFSGYFKHVPSILDYGLLQVLILHIWSDEHVIFDLTTIGELYRLRYLKIESNMTMKLPGKIRRLQDLGTLQVDARLSAVPSDIVHLEKLLHLRLRSESNLPQGVARMTSLRTLGYFDLGSNSEDNVRGLGELENLQDLQLTCSTVQPAESLGRNVQLLGSVLYKLSILQSVTLAPASGSCKGNTPSDYAAVSSMSISCDGFSSVSAPRSLQRLELSRHCCIFSRVPKWLGELAQLCTLKIAVRELSKEDIDILKALPALTALSLHVVTKSAEMIVFGKGGFSVLTYFKFTCTVPWLKFEADAMPNLQKLRLGFNDTILDKQEIIIEYLSGLKEISAIIGCADVGAASAWRKAITSDPRNPKLQCMGSIYVGDEGTRHVVTQEEAQETYGVQYKVSGGSEIMDETYGVQDGGSEASENSEDADRNDPINQLVHAMLLQRMCQKVQVWFLTPMTVLVRMLRPILSTVLAITVLGWLLSAPLKQHYVATAGWAMAVVVWLVSPIIGLLLPKILIRLGLELDLEQKIQGELEFRIIPELEKTLHAVDMERMMERGKKPKSGVYALDKMASMLRHARYEAEDILDDAHHKIVAADILYWHCLGIARIIQKGSARVLSLLCRFLGRPDVETLMADLKKISSELDTLLTDDDTFGQLRQVDRMRMIPKTLRANMMKMIPQLMRLRSEDKFAMELRFLHMMHAWLLPKEEEDIDDPQAEDNDDATNCFDKMVVLLRRAEEEDFHDEQQEIRSHASSWPHHLYGAVEAYIARYIGIARSGSSQLVQRARNIPWSRWFLRRSEDALRTTTINADASNEPAIPVAAPSDSSRWWLSCWCRSLDFFKNCCTSLFHWLLHVYVVARTHRDWSYGQVFGITTNYQENTNLLDFVLTAISMRPLRKRIERVESSISEVNKSSHLVGESMSKLADTANKNRSRIRTATKRKVFGQEALHADIIARLRETPHDNTPNSSTSSCYTVIGIYGVAGSGKTTLARYTQDYIKEKCNELFDTIMCIHVSGTFSVDDIFHEMLKDITNGQHSYISDGEKLEQKLKESLCGKRFFLVLDDLWVENMNDPQLQELTSPLNVGMKGSKILVTAQTKEAARALCADEPIKMPDLDEEQYFKMFMHYALGGISVDVTKFEQVGRMIAEKLHGSPIAAAVVAGQLGANPDISFWKNTLELDMLNDTVDALWWSYQQLNPDIRRCLLYCNIFHNRYKMEKSVLVHLWIAEGLVAGCAGEDLESVAEVYIQELVSHSFLEAEGTMLGTEFFSVHDLLRDLLDKVAGCDYYKILNGRSQRGESWNGDVPPDVRHLFVQSYDAELITKKILGLENLRTLIIDFAGDVEEKLIESVCKRLPKLRVLAIALSNPDYSGIGNTKKFLFPESIRLLKHLRYLAFRTTYVGMVILPSALTELHHIQLLDFGNNEIEFPSTGLIKLRHIICRYDAKVPNIGRFISLRTLQNFQVRNEEGYEVKQLMNLNNLCGSLAIHGLENVKSKREALEANLATKKWLEELKIYWTDDSKRCSPEVEEDVLEGLSPPIELERLEIFGYKGSKYPDWMVVSNQSGVQKELQRLMFVGSSSLGPGPPALEAFPYLRSLLISYCSWDSLPGNLEHLKLLKALLISNCKNFLSLPTLPQSLEDIFISLCDEGFMESCLTVGHPNWQKIEHIPNKHIPN